MTNTISYSKRKFHIMTPLTPVLSSFRLLILFTFLSWISTQESLAVENIIFRRVSPVGGFTDKGVSNIQQDKFGTIWIATYNSLFKYDSYNFEKYSFKDNAISPHKNIAIRDMMIDKNNNFWLGTGSEVYLFNPNSEKFEKVAENPQGDSQFLRDLENGNDSTILIAFLSSIYRYNPYTKTTTRLKHIKNDINRIHETADDRLLVAYNYGGVYSYHGGKEGRQIVPESDDKIRTAYISDDLIYIAYSQKGLYVYTRDGVLKETLNTENGKLSHNRINKIYKDSKGRLWLGNYVGLDIIDTDGSITHQKHLDNQEYSFSNNSVYSIFEDKHNNFWVGTWSGNLSYYNQYDNNFEHVFFKPGINSITNNYVRCFAEDEKKNIWIGTERGGLNKYNSESKKYEHVKLNNNDTRTANVIALESSKDGKLFLSAFLDGLYTIRNSTVSPSKYISNNTYNNKIYAIAIHNNDLWLGDYGEGLSKLDLTKHQITENYMDGNDSNSLSSPKITSLLADNKGLWIGTSQGLNFKPHGKKEFRKYLADENDLNSISSNDIASITKDLDHNIWIGTRSRGVNKYISSEDKFIHYTKEDGLAGEDANGIICDNYGYIWISSENGISRLDPSNGSILNYNATDGLQGNQFNRNAVFKASDGRLYFGGTNGYTVIDPSKLKYNPIIPNPIISQIIVDNVAITPSLPNSPLKKSISETKEIVLKYHESSISLSFVANNYLNPTKNKFSYRLVGLDNTWKTSFANTATFNHLQPGEYTFELLASNNDGIWSQTPKTLRITITPPLWLSKGAFALYIIVFFLICWAIWIMLKAQEKIKLERLKRKNEEQINTLKLQFFTNVSHEFKTPLTLILSPIQRILSNESIDDQVKEDLELAKKNAFRLKKLVNQFIELRKIDNAKLNLYLSNTEITTFAKDIYSCFKELADNKNIDYDFDQKIDPTQVFIDEDKIDKVIFNILSNAFKYTSDYGQIKMTIKPGNEKTSVPKNWKTITLGNQIESEYIKIAIYDSGSGISQEDLPHIFERFYVLEKTAQHTDSGIGLSLTKEYLHLHKCRITVSSHPDEGSVFEVEIPIKNEKLLEKPYVSLVEDAKKTPTNNIEKPMVKVAPKDAKPAKKNETQKNKDLPLVLVVEDNDELRAHMVSILENDFRVIVAEDGEIGHLKTVKFYPDIIVSDVMMPNVTGLELCDKIKSDLLTCHIPVILLTALAEDKHKIKGLETGADAYISKPFDIQLLITQINNLLEVRKKLRISIGDTQKPSSKKELLSTLDATLLKKAQKYIEDNIDNADISTNDLADQLAMSRTNLHRKLKSLTGQAATQFIKTIRLNKAMELIDNGNDSIEEIGYASGFNSTSYFSKCFIAVPLKSKLVL